MNKQDYILLLNCIYPNFFEELHPNQIEVNIMLEKMDIFFENRLSNYDEHMLTTIEGTDVFYQYTAALLPQEAETEALDLGFGTGLDLQFLF